MSKKQNQETKKQKLERYEQEIASSKLFSLDRETQPTAYSREALKLTSLLVEYLYAIDDFYESEKEESERYYRKFGVEITETIQLCLKNFSAEKGEFLHYFRASIKTACINAAAEQRASEYRGGIHIPEKIKKLMPKIAKYLESKGIDPEKIKDEQIELVADVFDQPKKTIREAIEANQFSNVVYDTATNEDGESISLFDLIASEEYADSRLLSEEKCKCILDQIEFAFSSCQDRQKPILTELLTTRLCKSGIFDDTDLHIVYSDYSFINKDLVKEYVLNRSILSDADIASKYEKDASSVSRTLNKFLAKVSKAI